MSATLNRLVQTVNEEASREAWEHPELSLVDGGLSAPPEFPLHLLGDFWAQWCVDAATGANAPLDYVALGLLATAAAVIGNARTISPARGHDWREPCIMWAALVGPPSAGKTPALKPLFDVVEEIEDSLAAGFEDQQRRHIAIVEAAKLNREAWEADARKCVKEGYPAPDLPADAMEPEPLVRPRLRIMDSTMEAAAEIAAGNPRGLLLVRDELAGWWRSFNRYGGDGERQFWLQAWNGGSYTVDRKKNGRPITARRLSISVLGGVQPDVLNAMLDSEQDGFAARFLFAFPAVVPGFKLKLAPSDLNRASPAFTRLNGLSMVEGGDALARPFSCWLDDDAGRRFESFWNRRKGDACAASGLWGDWLGKAGGLVLRLALVLEHLWWCSENSDSSESFPRTVSRNALDAAVELFEAWAAPMAQRAFGVAAMSAEDQLAAKLARWLRAEGLKEFNARAARLRGGGPGAPLSKPEPMAKACGRLVEAGLIRSKPKREGDTPGRRSSDYEVNPLLAMTESDFAIYLTDAREHRRTENID